MPTPLSFKTNSSFQAQNKLRIDAQNANATLFLALSPAFSPFYFQNTHISLYIVAHRKVEILGNTVASYEKKYLLSLKRLTSKSPFSGTDGIVSGNQTGRGIFFCLRAEAFGFAM